MKALIPVAMVAAAALLVVAQNPQNEQPPAGAAEKISEALPEKPYAEPNKSRRLLVFSATNGFRHASITTGKLLLAEMGRQTGAFEAVVSDDLENFERERLEGFDAVCFLNTTGDVFMPHPSLHKALAKEDLEAAGARAGLLKENLMRFIRSGRGFVGIHAATDTFYEWEEYGRMINGFFDGHPWNADTRVTVKVEPGQEQHPLVAMFEGEPVEFPEEIYQFRAPYDSKAVQMLLRLDTGNTDMALPAIKRQDGDFGISWARPWGEGRVFYSSLGHNHDMYWHPKVVRHYLAGIQWALGDLEVAVTGDAG